MYNIVIDIDRGFMYYLLALGDIQAQEDRSYSRNLDCTCLIRQICPAEPNVIVHYPRGVLSTKVYLGTCR